MTRSVLGSDPFERSKKESESKRRQFKKASPGGIKRPSSEEIIADGKRVFEIMDQRLAKGIEKTEDRMKEQLDKMETRLDSGLHDIGRRIKEYEKESEKRVEAAVSSIEEKAKEAIKSADIKDREERLRLLDGIIDYLRRFTGIISLESIKKTIRDLRMITRSDSVDDFGMDEVFEDLLVPFFDFFYDVWWRVETSGVNNVPSEGRSLLVSNHSGTLPYDGAMIKLAVRREHPARREVRFLVEDFAFYFPVLSRFLARIGGVRACQENAQRLLERDQLVSVFPEGVKGIGKYYRDRYQLQRFGRGGFVRLCLRTASPLMPVSIVGAEEIHPLIGKHKFLAKLIGAPYIPITLTFPWLGPLGLIPFPTKWYIDFGTPIDMGRYGRKSVDDDIFVNSMSERVRSIIQKMVAERLQARSSIFFG